MVKIKLIVIILFLVSSCCFLSGFRNKDCHRQEPSHYSIDVGRKIPLVAKMSIGANISHFNDSMRNWPVSALDIIKNAGISSVRTHDIKSLDWDVIFPDFQADANDPSNYHFEKGDAILQKCTEAGFDILLRLGVSTEAANKQRQPGIDPPDPAKWTAIVDHILQHYTAGWSNTSSYNIHYVELWNEPDIKFWGGSHEDFIKLAVVSLPTLEKHFPRLKFGGFALSNLAKSKDFADGLLAAMADPNGDGNTSDRIRLDFFSWHVYEMQKGTLYFSQFSALCKELLAKHGYEASENICTEWNAALPSNYLQTSDAATDICSTLIYAAKSNMSGLYFYPLVDSWGLINAPVVNVDYRKFQKTKLYEAFALFSAVYSAANGMYVVEGGGSDEVFASTADNRIKILLSRRQLGEAGFKIDFTGLDLSKAAISVTLFGPENITKKNLNPATQTSASITMTPADLNHSDVVLLSIQN